MKVARDSPKLRKGSYLGMKASVKGFGSYMLLSAKVCCEELKSLIYVFVQGSFCVSLLPKELW